MYLPPWDMISSPLNSVLKYPEIFPFSNTPPLTWPSQNPPQTAPLKTLPQSPPLLTYIGGPKGEALHLLQVQTSILRSHQNCNLFFHFANQNGSLQKQVVKLGGTWVLLTRFVVFLSGTWFLPTRFVVFLGGTGLVHSTLDLHNRVTCSLTSSKSNISLWNQP